MVVAPWVGGELEVSEVVVDDELFFICGRSKMSRTEKLDDRGILISNNLEIDKRKFIYINSMESIVTVVVLSIEMLFVVIQDHLDIEWQLLDEAQCSKIRKKVQFQKYKNTFFEISKMAKNQFSNWEKV